MMLTRQSMQVLSRQRLKEARVLHGAGLWAGAYYLAGYTVELALKACILRRKRKHEVPFSREDAAKIYTHNLESLRQQAGLHGFPDPAVQTNWLVIKDWNETYRYREDVAEAKSRDLLAALEGRKGVLTWLRKYW